MNEKPPFKLFGIFGYPLSHTLSPAMQESAFAAAGVQAFYGAFELEKAQFHRAMRNPKKLALDGFNITVPYKREVMRHLDTILPEAKAIGAVNTVFRKNGKWIGANTDVNGFLLSLKWEGRFNPRGKRVLVFGAGGAARAVIYGLASAGARSILVANRDLERAKKLIQEFRKKFPKTKFGLIGLKSFSKRAAIVVIGSVQLVVNATSVGLKPGPSLVPGAWIPRAGKKKLFYDLIYHRKKTEFMAEALKKGHHACGGLGMLLYQGTKAFELWTGKKAPVAVMRRALVEALNAKGKA